MTLTINISVALLIALGLSVGVFLVSGRHEARAAQALASAEASLTSVRDAAERERATSAATRLENSLSPILRRLSKRGGDTERVVLRATAIRLSLAQRLIPLALFLLALGALAGMLRRDRARDLVLYSSVTFSYIGKLLALAATAFGVFVALSPFGPPLWTLYPAIGTSALGAAIYIGNLPPRL